MNESIDFAQAYHNGINLFRNRVAEEAEIDAVLSRFCEEVHTASKGNLVLEVGRRPYGNPSDLKVIAIKRSKSKARGRKTLVDIEPSQGGYPCVIRHGGWFKSVIDKDGLEASLAEVLQSHSAAHKIHYLLTRSYEDTNT